MNLMEYIFYYIYIQIHSNAITDISLYERYNTLTGIILSNHTLEERTIELENQRISFKEANTKKKETGPNLPKFIFDIVNRLPQLDIRMTKEEINDVIEKLRGDLPPMPLD